MLCLGTKKGATASLSKRHSKSLVGCDSRRGCSVARLRHAAPPSTNRQICQNGSDFKLRADDLKLRGDDSKLRLNDFKFPIDDFNLQVADAKVRFAHSKLGILKFRASNPQFQVPFRRFEASNRRFQAPNPLLQISNPPLQASNRSEKYRKTTPTTSSGHAPRLGRRDPSRVRQHVTSIKRKTWHSHHPAKPTWPH